METILWDSYTVRRWWWCEVCGQHLAPQMVRVRYEAYTRPDGGCGLRVAAFRCLHHELTDPIRFTTGGKPCLASA